MTPTQSSLRNSLNSRVMDRQLCPAFGHSPSIYSGFLSPLLTSNSAIWQHFLDWPEYAAIPSPLSEMTRLYCQCYRHSRLQFMAQRVQVASLVSITPHFVLPWRKWNYSLPTGLPKYIRSRYTPPILLCHTVWTKACQHSYPFTKFQWAAVRFQWCV